MKVRYKNSLVEGYSSGFNVHGLGEILVNGDWGGDSAYIRDMEVYLSNGEWKCLKSAFKDKDVIPDNHHVWFGEPRAEEDRTRGYFE